MICESTEDIAEATKRLLRNDTTIREIIMPCGCVNSAEVLETFVSAMETSSITNLQLKIFVNYDFGTSIYQHRGFIQQLVRCDCICDLILFCSFSIYFSIYDFDSIVEAISQNDAIKSLEIRCSRLGKEAVAAIAKLLHSGRISLQSLILWLIRDEGCGVLMEALSTYSSLKVLHMCNCDIGIKGAKAIGKLLRSGECAIEELNLSDNNSIGDAGCAAVMVGLLENSSIQILDMKCFGIGKEGAEKHCQHSLLWKMCNSGTQSQ